MTNHRVVQNPWLRNLAGTVLLLAAAACIDTSGGVTEGESVSLAGIHNKFGIGLTEAGNSVLWDRMQELVGPGGWGLIVCAEVDGKARGASQGCQNGVRELAARGLNVIVRLGPHWHDRRIRNDADPGSQHKSYIGLGKIYRRVVDDLLKAMGNHQVELAIQVGNEVNLCYEWMADRGVVLHYSDIAAEVAGYQRDVGDALHSIGDSRLRVVSVPLAPGGAARCEYNAGNTGDSWPICPASGNCFVPGSTSIDFFDQMVAAVPKLFSEPRFDGFGSHAYPAAGIGHSFFVPPGSATVGLKVYEQELAAAGASLPVYITETGWPTTHDGHRYSFKEIGQMMLDAYLGGNAQGPTGWVWDTKVRAVTPFVMNHTSAWDRFSYLDSANRPRDHFALVREARCRYYWTPGCPNPPPAVPKPDLVVEALSWSPMDPAAGESLDLSVVVRNQGKVRASGSIQVSYFVDGQFIGAGREVDLDVGAKKSGFKLPQGWRVPHGGSFEVRAVVDEIQTIPEENELNNARSRTLSVAGGAPSPASELQNDNFSNGIAGWSYWQQRGRVSVQVNQAGRLQVTGRDFNGGVYQQIQTGGAGVEFELAGHWQTDQSAPQAQWAEVLVIHGERTPAQGQDVHEAQSDVDLLFKNDTWTSPKGWQGAMADTAPVTRRMRFVSRASTITLVLKSGSIGGDVHTVSFDGLRLRRMEGSETPTPPAPHDGGQITNGDFASDLSGWNQWSERGLFTAERTPAGWARIAGGSYNGGLYQRIATGGAGNRIRVGGQWSTDQIAEQAQWAEVLVIQGGRTPGAGQDVSPTAPDTELLFKNDTWRTPAGWSGTMADTAAVQNSASFVATGDWATIVLKTGSSGPKVAISFDRLFAHIEEKAEEAPPVPPGAPKLEPSPLSGCPDGYRADKLKKWAAANGRNLGFPKIGFHMGPGGNAVGIGDFMRCLDAVGIPFFLKSVDAGGPIWEAAKLREKSGVPHVLVYRKSEVTNSDVDKGWDPGVPYTGFPQATKPPPANTPYENIYNETPAQAAATHWRRHRDAFPSELIPYKKWVWLETVNEINKGNFNLPHNQGLTTPFGPYTKEGEWMADFSLRTAKLARAEGFRYAAFSWSSGEPEQGQWAAPKALEYLRYAAQHPDEVSLAIHEYSYNNVGLDHNAPHLVGRFEEIYEVADHYGIARPAIVITEFGWEYDSVPSAQAAFEKVGQLPWAAELYADHPEVLGAAIWYLGPGFGGIANQTQPLIRPMLEFTLQNYYLWQ